VKILFKLGWVKGNALPKVFKMEAAYALLKECLERTAKFTSVSLLGMDASWRKAAGDKLWFCHTSKNSKELSSEELAKIINQLQNSGTRQLHIAVGGPNGFTPQDIEKWAPDFLWCFGRLTLPHELATVVAAEQIYRAYTIIHHHPYHSGH